MLHMKEETGDSKTLNELIKEAGLKLQDIAEALNYNRATIRGRRNNPEQFTVQELIILSRLLKKTPTAILKTLLRDMKGSQDSLFNDLLKAADDYLDKKK